MLLSFACIEDAIDLSKDFFFSRAVEKVLCGGSRPAAGELFLQQPQGLLTLLLGRRWSLTMCFETGFLAHCWFCTSKGGENHTLLFLGGDGEDIQDQVLTKSFPLLFHLLLTPSCFYSRATGIKRCCQLIVLPFLAALQNHLHCCTFGLIVVFPPITVSPTSSQSGSPAELEGQD